MAIESADEYRARAAQARRISGGLQDPKAQNELRDMADALDAEADRIEKERGAPNPVPPPSNDI